MFVDKNNLFTCSHNLRFYFFVRDTIMFSRNLYDPWSSWPLYLQLHYERLFKISSDKKKSENIRLKTLRLNQIERSRKGVTVSGKEFKLLGHVKNKEWWTQRRKLTRFNVCDSQFYCHIPSYEVILSFDLMFVKKDLYLAICFTISSV